MRLRESLLVGLVACGAQTGDKGAAPAGGNARPVAAPLDGATEGGTAGVRPEVDLARGCPTPSDALRLLARSAELFGAPTAIASELPLRLPGQGKSDLGLAYREEVLLTTDRTRVATWFFDDPFVTGIDGVGGTTSVWAVGSSGVRTPRLGEEAARILAEDWFRRRAFVTAFDPARDSIVCREAPGAGEGEPPAIAFRYSIAALGAPIVFLDSRTLAPSALAVLGPDRPAFTMVRSWSAPDAKQVRWPELVVEHAADETGHQTSFRTGEPGDTCAGPQGPPLCAVPPDHRWTVTWPASLPVVVPYDSAQGAPIFDVTVGGAPARAFLTLASTDLLVASTIAENHGFRPKVATSATLSNSAQIPSVFGTFDSIAIGALSLEHVPGATADPRALSAYDDVRVGMGQTLLEVAAVRVDVQKGLLKFAPTAVALVSKNAIRLPLVRRAAAYAVAGQVNGRSMSLTLETASRADLVAFKSGVLSEIHGDPWPVSLVVGGKAAAVTMELVPSIDFPPLHQDTALLFRDAGEHAATDGILGGSALEGCAAYVIDVPRRALWLEPPCDRAQAPNRSGLTARYRESAHGWVAVAIEPASPAETAGVQSGDRLLSVGGAVTTRDPASWQIPFRTLEARKVSVTVVRGQAHVPLILALPDRHNPRPPLLR